MQVQGRRMKKAKVASCPAAADFQPPSLEAFNAVTPCWGLHTLGCPLWRMILRRATPAVGNIIDPFIFIETTTHGTSIGSLLPQQQQRTTILLAGWRVNTYRCTPPSDSSPKLHHHRLQVRPARQRQRAYTRITDD